MTQLEDEGTGGVKNLADRTRDELIDEVVRSEQREQALVEDLRRANDALNVATTSLEQSGNEGVLADLATSKAKANRLWTAINDWYEKHKRGCEYAMQPGGFCAEDIWVKRLIDTEEELEAAPLGDKAT